MPYFDEYVPAPDADLDLSYDEFAPQWAVAPQEIPIPAYVPGIQQDYESAYGPGGINRQVWLDHLRRKLNPALTDEQVEAFFEEKVLGAGMAEAMRPPVTMVPSGAGSEYLNRQGAYYRQKPGGVHLEQDVLPGVYRHEVAHSISDYDLRKPHWDPDAMEHVEKGYPLHKTFMKNMQNIFPGMDDADSIKRREDKGLETHSWKSWELYPSIIAARMDLGRLYTADDIKFYREVDVNSLSQGQLNTYGILANAIQGNIYKDLTDQQVADALNEIAQVDLPAPDTPDTRGLA